MAKTLIYGIHAVESALRNDPGNLGRIWLDENSRNARLHTLIPMIEEKGFPAIKAHGKKLEQLTRTDRHQGIVAEYNEADAGDENDLLRLLDQLDDEGTAPFLLILDGVTDPHNLGACLRTADGAGIHAVVVPRDNAAGLTPTARKVASGAAETVPFIAVTNLARTLDALKERGVWLTGTSDKADQTLHQANLKGATAIVMGAEGKGIRRLTEERCDFLIAIPMAGDVSSLNVSVATGVCLYEAVRQRAS